MSVSGSDVSLSRYDIVGLLEETDKELSEGEPIHITLAGGAAMLFWNEKRGGTKDVDVIVPSELPEELIAAARSVAARHDLSPGWLNATATLIPQPQLSIVPEQIFEGENRLTAFIADPKYVLLMKLLAARPQDRHDAVILARRTGMRNYDGLVHAMKKAFPAEIHEDFNLPFIAGVADRA